jgi:U3 small nucleolar RNA-associated protein 14
MAVGNAGRGGSRGGRGGRGKHTHSRRGKIVEEDGVAEHDVYEAEQLEPEEKRNKIVKRYDQVENYEYEMPSDFEDEEVSEDEAFDSDDERKFAHFFQVRRGGLCGTLGYVPQFCRGGV